MKAFKCDWCKDYQQGAANTIESKAVGYIHSEEICDACEKKVEAIRKKIMEGKA